MNIPTIIQIYNGIISDIESELSITIPTFGRSFLKAQAMVQAGRLWLLYLVTASVQKNIFVDTCDEETLGRFGLVKLGRNRFPATQAQYEVLVSGTTGATIVAGTTFKANDDSQSPGQLFVLDTDFTLDGINLIILRALEAGIDSSLAIGNGLTATIPIALVNAVGIVQSELIEPQEAETISVYRQKIIEAFRLEAQGGSASDYRLWASEVQGINQTYPYAAIGLSSEVNLYIESDNLDGIPTLTDIDNVRDAIELPTVDRPARKPTTVIVNYLPIVPQEIDIEITGFVGINAEIEALIFSAIESKLSTVRPFVGAIDVVANQNDYFDANSIISTILEVRPGSVFGAVTMTVEGLPQTSFIFTDGFIPSLTSISYV